MQVSQNRDELGSYKADAPDRGVQEGLPSLDHHLWQHLYKWACRRHPTKSRGWVTARYFGQFHPTRRDRWIFGDRASGAYLHQYAWTKIVGHVPVPGSRYSPDDPDWPGITGSTG